LCVDRDDLGTDNLTLYRRSADRFI
jgi:hypothetical protein